jgi:hypothetical protein
MIGTPFQFETGSPPGSGRINPASVGVGGTFVGVDVGSGVGVNVGAGV